MSWSITLQENVRDVKPALERALDQWIETAHPTREDIEQVRAAITAAEVLISRGAVGRQGVVVALSGHAVVGGGAGTVSIAVSDAPEDLPVIHEEEPRVVAAEPSGDDAEQPPAPTEGEGEGATAQEAPGGTPSPDDTTELEGGQEPEEAGTSEPSSDGASEGGDVEADASPPATKKGGAK